MKHITYIKKGVWGRVQIDNGSSLVFKSYEQGREKFQGVGKRLIWFDEEPPQDIWEEAFVRVEAGTPLDIVLTMTPINGMTYIYDTVYLADNPDIFVITAGWKDNPWLEKEQIARMSRGLSDATLEVRKEGRFVRKTGLVNGWWKRDFVKDNIQKSSSDNFWMCRDRARRRTRSSRPINSVFSIRWAMRSPR